MKTRGVMLLAVTLVAVTLVLLPVPALAAFCLSPSAGSTLILAIDQGLEGFIGVRGVLNGPCTSGLSESTPVTGTGRFLPNQDAEMSLFAGPTPSCNASFFYVRLFAAQGYQQGTGQIDNPGVDFFQPRTYTMVACP